MSVPLATLLHRLRIEGLLEADPPAELADVEVTGITTDSRFIQSGRLFCAVRGTVGDGHAFLRDARERGAVAALVEVPDAGIPLPQILVTNGRRAGAFAAAAFYGDPWRGMTLLGVTGTNGKTTTVAMLRHLLARSGRAASIGTLGVMGPDDLPSGDVGGLTTPGPAQFAEMIARLRDAGVTSVAMEVSSHALEQERVSAASFAGAVLTNLSRDHLDYHGTFETYRAAKLKLIDLVREAGVLATNIDDPAWEGVSRSGVHLVRYGARGRGEVQAKEITFDARGVSWRLHTPSCTATVHLPLFGIYNVYNALGAASVLWGLGWTADRIAEGLADLGQVPGRLERLPTATGPAVVIDYAHTPDALRRALRALRPLVRGRLTVVFGAGGDRDPGKRPEMGRAAASHADFSIITSDNPRSEDPLSIAADIERGMGDAPRLTIVDRREAIARALEMATPEDLVLLAGKGHETYQIWGSEYRPFDERQVVAEILERKGIAI